MIRGIHACNHANIHVNEKRNVIVYERKIDAYEYGYYDVYMNKEVQMHMNVDILAYERGK